MASAWPALQLGGSIGGCGGGGGGGTVEREELLEAEDLSWVTSVNEWALLCSEACSYSQHGRTRCPEGASSNWKLSVPGGKDWLKSLSAGPQKWSSRVRKSKIALFFRNAVRPNNPGSSEPVTVGVVRCPIVTVSPLVWRKATGNLQS